MKEILLVGNGFDAAMGLKTGYKDFVAFVEAAFAAPREQRTPLQVRLTELCNVNGFFRHFHFSLANDESWRFFEEEMDGIIAALLRFQDVILENQKDPDYDPATYNIIGTTFAYGDMLEFKYFARIFEQVYDDPAGGLFKLRQQFVNPKKRLDQPALLAEVRRELDAFTAALDLYITEAVAEDAQVPAFLQTLTPTYVINMNYTPTPRALGLSPEQIFYAKGKAGEEPSGIVLGSPAEPKNAPDWLYVNTGFQSLMKQVGLPKKEEVFAPEGMALTVFGYSFPESDEALLSQLFKAAKEVRVCYRDREEYARLLLQLMKLFGREEITAKLYEKTLVFCQML